MTPDGVPPLVDPDRFDLDAELMRLARIVFCRMNDIALGDLDGCLEGNPFLQEDFNAFLDDFLVQRQHRSTLAGPMVFEVHASPEGEFVRDGQRYAIINRYRLNYVNPPKPTHRVQSWAVGFGQTRSSQS